MNKGYICYVRRYFIHMAFDGSNYHGWQIQQNAVTVQEILEHALSTLLGEKISVVGAGRTDTGVHASFFIAHFESDDPFVNDKLVFKLNRFLPEDIVIYRIFKVSDDMHARFSATYRTYHYHMTGIKPLFTRKYTHFIYGDLHIKEIERCCKALFDYSDFTSFSKLHTDVQTNNCKIMKAEWKREPEGYLFEIQADRFLRNMVRSITGTLLDVGSGRLDEKGFRDIIEAKDRSKAGSSVPAQGLFLTDIGYSEKLLAD